MAELRVALGFCAAAVTGFAAAHIAALPPWEGMDEFGHYAYVQHLADGHGLPHPSDAPLSRDVADYMREAPMPYSVAAGGGLTYRQVFESGADAVERVRRRVGAPPATPRRFEAAAGTHNVQAQHPPLYYLLLSPVYAATRAWSWRSQLFVLRLVSLAFALSAAAVGIAAAAAWPAGDGGRGGATPWLFMAAGIVAWPVIVPMWVPEMARLGNDGLCALWVAVSWLFLLRIAAGADRLADHSGLGVALGLGALTKAFFIPISAGVGAYLAWRCYRLARDGRRARPAIVGALTALALVAAIASWWYLRTLALSGGLVGGTFAEAREAGASWADLAAKFELWPWLRGVVGIATSFVWSGTWSFVRPPAEIRAPLLIVPATMAVLYLLRLRRARPETPVWLPLFMVAPMAAGLIYQGLVWIALHGGRPATNGWYLHIFFVPLGATFAWCARRLWDSVALRAVVALGAGYGLAFSAAALALHAALYAGIAVPGPGAVFAFPGGADDMAAAISEVWDRLGALALPRVGAALLAAAGACLAIGAVLLWRARSAPDRPNPAG